LHDSVVDELNIGIYSRKVDVEHLMEEGDRLEIYRDLTADPKEVRRQLALIGKSMGKK
jgi:putative ubiquitin-RnfH superfamily antitoxin RatB of RatAB toxin-antitoxin module